MAIFELAASLQCTEQRDHTKYNWPGNVRQLENVTESAIVLGSSEVLRPEDLPDDLLGRATKHSTITKARTWESPDEPGSKKTVSTPRLSSSVFEWTEELLPSLEDLEKNPVLASEPAKSVMVAATPDGTGARIFLSGDYVFSHDRTESGRASFSQMPRRNRNGTPSRGLRSEAPLFKNRLKEVPSFLSYWFAWKAFFPDTTVLKR